MQLDIGGAETHVTELAKELVRRGFYVVVVSSGGVYVRELEKNGVKHYTVPLNNKNPVNVFKAYSELKKIITDEKIDIVHSHARIPSFILGKLHNRMGFPFVTTAHWVFTTKYGLKYITDWGEYTVAVSEDIKQYLMDNYRIPENRITVTINGIDTESFSADRDSTAVMREFGLRDGDRVIVYVSRMDKDRSLAAKLLIAAAERLYNRIENLRILVVGGGNDFENVKAEADAVNKRLGRDIIKLAGARTDIAELVSAAELFVGVSRAALEAMAAQKPVIIAGNEGYIGLFDETKLDEGIRTNFCCRGCEMSDEEKLLNDITRFFEMSDEEKAALGSYGRRIVEERYSVAKMTDDTLRAYKQALGETV